MDVLNLGEQKVIYLTNALGEETREIEESIYKEYENKLVDNDWLHYLVEFNGNIGILSLQEIPHPECADWKDSENDYCSKEWKTSTSKEIWTHLESVAQKIENLIDFKVLLGEETGFMERHELCIWFPLETEKTSIQESFHKIEGIKLLY